MQVSRALLSEREIDVIRLLEVGYTNRRIADELMISPRTVQRHVSTILSKLGAENRGSAVWTWRQMAKVEAA